jgi:cytochrome c-type biogenesis protein CcmH
MRRPPSPIPRAGRAIAVALAGLLLAPAAAVGQCPQTTLGEVEQEVMCPVCGTPLALATEAPQAEREREFIVERIERCQSKDEIKAALVAQFGEQVLATPGDDGLDLAAYLLPALAVVIGAGGIALATLRWRRGRAAAAGPPQDPGASRPSQADAARLDRDLERYDL